MVPRSRRASSPYLTDIPTEYAYAVCFRQASGTKKSPTPKRSGGGPDDRAEVGVGIVGTAIGGAADQHVVVVRGARAVGHRVLAVLVGAVLQVQRDRAPGPAANVG